MMRKIFSFVVTATLVLATAAAAPDKEVRSEQDKKLKDIEQAPLVSPN
mgnify:CR=1 FL=1|jgi:hypothetical protein